MHSELILKWVFFNLFQVIFIYIKLMLSSPGPSSINNKSNSQTKASNEFSNIAKNSLAIGQILLYWGILITKKWKRIFRRTVTDNLDYSQIFVDYTCNLYCGCYTFDICLFVCVCVFVCLTTLCHFFCVFFISLNEHFKKELQIR